MISALITSLRHHPDIQPDEKVRIDVNTFTWSTDWIYSLFGNIVRHLNDRCAYGYSRVALKNHLETLMEKLHSVHDAIYDEQSPYRLTCMQRVNLRHELARLVTSLSNLKNTYSLDVDLMQYLKTCIGYIQTFVSRLMSA